MPACKFLAQKVPQPDLTVERMVATCWVTNHVKPLPPKAVANGQALHGW
jgi:hypothetical protein